MMHGNLKFHPHQHRRRPSFLSLSAVINFHMSDTSELRNVTVFVVASPGVQSLKKKRLMFSRNVSLEVRNPPNTTEVSGPKTSMFFLAKGAGNLRGIRVSLGFRSTRGMGFIPSKIRSHKTFLGEKSQVCLLKTVKTRQKPKFQLSLFQTNT